MAMGLGCVYLWHVQVFPTESWKHYLEYGEDFFVKVATESQQLGTLGSTWLSMMIDSLEIPIGYVNTYLLIAPEAETFVFFINTATVLGAELNLLPIDYEMAHTKPMPTRKLLLESFNVEQTKRKMIQLFCPRCKEGFNPRITNYKFCPYCGTKLESKV